MAEMGLQGDHSEALAPGARRLSSKAGVVVLAVTCAVLGSVLAPAGRAVAASISNVFVTNSPTNPVPTAAQGTTNVTGSVAVNGSVSVAEPVTLDAPVEIAGTVQTRPSLDGALSTVF